MKFLRNIHVVCAVFLCAAQLNVYAQIEFIQNKGQWNTKIDYKGDFKTGAFFLHNNGFTVKLNDTSDIRKAAELSHSHHKKDEPTPRDFTFHSFAYNVSFVGANTNPEIVPDKPLPTYNNYFIGNDQSKWAGSCKIYHAVTYKNIYPNIDIRYYSTQNKLKYDFIVHPGGNPSKIAMRYEGANSLTILMNELIVGTTVGDVKELSPYSYQTNVSSHKDITTKYRVKNDIVSFDIEKYDKTATLIIDPQLVFSSFTGSTEDNWGFTATPGADGSFYSGGITFGTGFPVTLGAYQVPYGGGGFDISIFKFSPNGAARVYATYIGGTGEEQPHSIIADAAGNLIIAGRSNSPNYPRLTGIPSTGSGFDIIISKLNATGSALIGSVKIGGSSDDGKNTLERNYGDDARSEVILDATNNVILASCTQSNNFPLQSPVQASFGGVQDGVILKLTADLSSLIFSTYFGGVGIDACFVASINPITNNLYVGGATASNNLPGNTFGTINPSFRGIIDGFVTELQPNGASIIKTTYIGTSDVDVVYGLKFDRQGFPYIMGTSKGNMPNTIGAYNVVGARQFIAKMQTDLSAFIYLSNFGKNDPFPSISPVAFLVDRCENVYVSGWGGNVNGGFENSGTLGLPEVNPIPGIPVADGSDFYFFVLKKDAQLQLFGSHFGQNGGAGEHVDGGTSRFDDNGIIYQAMCANCLGFGTAQFPTFPAGPTFPWSSLNPSSNCNLAAVKINMNFAGVAANVKSSISGVLNDTLGCYPIQVDFRDTVQSAVKYYWNFNSVTFPANTDIITTIPSTSFLYSSGGTFRVRLIAEDSSTCNIRDTSYINIEITNRIVNTNITSRKLGACTEYKYEFTNNTTASDATAFTNTSFVWDYGDGSPKDTVNKTPVRMHTFPGPGPYYVTMTTIDRRFCNTPKIDTIVVNSNLNVKAKPKPILLLCGQIGGVFDNESINGKTWKWEFVNSATSNIIGISSDSLATFNFPGQGKYKYRLIAYNPNTCNLSDTSAYFSVTIINKPIAKFDYTPNPPEVNKPFKFINQSSFATRYLWNFGDGQNSTLFEPTHEYLRKQSYNVKLIAYNEFDNLQCTDTASFTVTPIIDPLLDVPNAFTPGKFGENSIVYVRGFGIDKMNWRIYNRWGELVFKSSDKKVGWDGFYKGKLQPTDVYTYTLDVVFIDGINLKRTGDITLLR